MHKQEIIPDRICIELTNKCNVKCTFCDREDLKSKGMLVEDMSNTLIEKIINDILLTYSPNSKLKDLVLVGLGEPTMASTFDYFLELVSSVSDRVENIELTTNGIPLVDRRIKQILNSTINNLTISLNFVDRERYLEIMGSDSSEKVVLNIIKLLKLKKKIGSTLRLRIQLMDDGCRDVQNELKDLKIRLNKHTDAYTSFHVQPLYSKPVVVNDSCGLNVSFTDSTRYPCWSMYSILYIDINGNTYPCTIGNDSYRENSDLLIGNVYDSDIREIFNSTQIDNARLNAENNKLPFKECKDCNIWEMLPNKFQYSESKGWVLKGNLLDKYSSRYRLSIYRFTPKILLNFIKDVYSYIYKHRVRKFK